MYLVIGGSGFLGRYCIKNILDFTDDSILATYSSQKPSFTNERLKWVNFNVCDYKKVDLISKKIDKNTKVIYLAAYHHPDLVLKNPNIAWNINITALCNIINKFESAKCFYYSSTDSVYGDGDLNHKFTENDELNAVNLYGKQKIFAEKICLERNRNVVRFPFIFGPSLVENKLHFYDKIVNSIKNKNKVDLFCDSYRSTLSFQQCAYFLIKIIENFGECEHKLINIASDDVLSKYDVGEMLIEKLDFDKKLLQKISVNDVNETIFIARRAKTTLLDNSLLKKILNIKNIHFEI